MADENNYINRSNSNYSTTAEALKAKLVETHGGFLRVRHETTEIIWTMCTTTAARMPR